MKKIVGVTGYKGRLGSYLLNRFDHFVGLDCDVTDPESIDNSIQVSRPDLILHLAAKSDVEFCERPSNSDLVTSVNFRGTYNTLLAAEDAGLEVILLSSDHVFDGKWWGKYLESSKPNPINFYGMSKLAAESLSAVFDNLKVIRTSYLFDEQRLKDTLTSLWNGASALDSPTFIYRSFMYIPHFVNALIYYIENLERMPALLNISGNKVVSWDKFNRDTAKVYKISDKYVKSRDREIDGLARRPNKGGLDVRWSRNLGLPQYSYFDGLLDMAKR